NRILRRVRLVHGSAAGTSRDGSTVLMDLGIRGRTALVLGASGGIGEAVALELAREGVRLALAARRLAELERVADAAKKLGALDAHALAVDLADSDSIARMLAGAGERLGNVDIVILN